MQYNRGEKLMQHCCQQSLICGLISLMHVTKVPPETGTCAEVIPCAGPPAAAPEVDSDEDDDDGDVEGDDDGEVDDGLGGLLAEGGQPAGVPPVDCRHGRGGARLGEQSGGGWGCRCCYKLRRRLF